MEITRDDVIKLILQFLQENGFTKAQQELQNESGVILNLVDSKQNLKRDIVQGRWDQVLSSIKLYKFQGETLLNLYELIIQELVEVNETQTANQFFLQMVVPSMQEYKERLLRLDYLIRKPGKLNLNEIYLDNLSKEERRLGVANQIINECIEAPPCRLLELLGDSLKHLYANKIVQKVDLLVIGQKDEKVNQLSQIEKIVKYSEKMRVNCVTFTPDANSLIIGSIDGIIEVWDPEKLALRNDLSYQGKEEFMMHNGCVINLNATNELLTSLDSNGQVKVWKLKTGKCLKIIESTHPKQITTVLLGKDPQQLFIASDMIQLYGLKSGITQKQFRGHESLVTSMFTSAEGSRLYTGSLDQTFRVWDVHSNEQIYILKCESAVEKLVSIQGQILICQRGKQIILLSNNFTELRRFTSETDLVSFASQPDFVYGLGNGQLYSFELHTGKGLKLLPLPSENMQDIAIGKNLLVCFSQCGHLVFIK